MRESSWKLYVWRIITNVKYVCFYRYPSRFHYEQVAQQLIKEYPCLAQNNIPSAKPYVSPSKVI